MKNNSLELFNEINKFIDNHPSLTENPVLIKWDEPFLEYFNDVKSIKILCINNNIELIISYELFLDEMHLKFNYNHSNEDFVPDLEGFLVELDFPETKDKLLADLKNKLVDFQEDNYSNPFIPILEDISLNSKFNKKIKWTISLNKNDLEKMIKKLYPYLSYLKLNIWVLFENLLEYCKSNSVETLLNHLFTSNKIYTFPILRDFENLKLLDFIIFCPFNKIEVLSSSQIREKYIFNTQLLGTILNGKKEITNFSKWSAFKPPELFLSENVIVGAFKKWQESIQHLVIILILSCIASEVIYESNKYKLIFKEIQKEIFVENQNYEIVKISGVDLKVQDIWNPVIDIFNRYLTHPKRSIINKIQISLQKIISDPSLFITRIFRAISDIGPQFIPINLPCSSSKIQIATIQLEAQFDKLISRKSPDIIGLYKIWNPDGLKEYKQRVSKIITEIIKDRDSTLPLLIIMPELSIPESFIDYLVSFSKGKNIIFIAGSHYAQKIRGGVKININRSPIIYSSIESEDPTILFSEKYKRAYFEDGVRDEDKIENGDTIYYLNYCGYIMLIAICIDFLNLQSYCPEQLLNKASGILCPRASTKTDEFDRLSESYHNKFIIFSSLTGLLPENKKALGKTAIWGSIDYQYRNKKIARQGLYERELETLSDDFEGYILATLDLSITTTISRPVDFRRDYCGYNFKKKKVLVLDGEELIFKDLPDQITERLQILDKED